MDGNAGQDSQDSTEIRLWFLTMHSRLHASKAFEANDHRALSLPLAAIVKYLVYFVVDASV